jgi:hypothetical protein
MNAIDKSSARRHQARRRRRSERYPGRFRVFAFETVHVPHWRRNFRVAVVLLVTVLVEIAVLPKLFGDPVTRLLAVYAPPHIVFIGQMVIAIVQIVITWLVADFFAKKALLLLQWFYIRGIPSYIEQVSDRHAVTRRFGNDILSEFLEGYLPQTVFDDISYNLPALLRNLEDRGTTLTIDLYARLLEKSAEVRPQKVIAVWDCQTVPISSVFDDAGVARNGNILRYFNTLDVIYSLISAAEDKPRAFLFASEVDMREQTAHPGWAALMKLHERWGVSECVYLVEKCERLNDVKLENHFPFEDFVYFKMHKCKENHWFIGFDRDTHRAKLGRGRAAEDAEKVWQAISQMSRPVSAEAVQ